MADAAAVDAALQRIMAVTLIESTANASARPPVLFLKGILEELQQEQQQLPQEQQVSPVLMNAANMERVLVYRLIEAAPEQYPQPPFDYLLGAYSRAVQEIRSVSDAQLRATIDGCMELLVSYAGLILTGSGVVPEPEGPAARGALQLLDSLEASIAADQMQPVPPGVTPLPRGFLEELAAQQEQEALQSILGPVVSELARRVQGSSPLGPYSAPLAAVKRLGCIESVARALVGLPSFRPNLQAGSGRALQLPASSWLGPCFSVSAIEDDLIKAEPSVWESCFKGVAAGSRNMGDVVRHRNTLHLASKYTVGELHAIVKALLGKTTREEMMGWLADALNGNRERAKMQENLAVAASHGLFLNLDAVLLKLCGPFMDVNSAVFWKRVDWKYVVLGDRLDFKEDTKLAVSQTQERAWIEKEKAAAAAAAADGGSSSSSSPSQQPGGGYHFICEVFFMTLQALHLGLLKICGNYRDEAKYLQELTQMMKDMEAAKAALPPGDMLHSMRFEAQLQQVQKEQAKLEAHVMGYDTALSDPEFIADCFAFYKLLAAWLLSLVVPGGNINHPELPLPQVVPPSWSLLPEYFVEDMADFLLLITQLHPNLLAANSAGLDRLMIFMVVFIGSPGYLKNPFLRSKLTDVLHMWLPPRADQNSGFRRTRMSDVAASVSYLFEGHPLVLQHLTPSLLNLYTDVEVTDRNNQFYEKFSMRQNIGDILMHCWTLQPHRDAWKAHAAQQGGRGAYLRFANMLINDSIYLIDEALKHVKEVRGFDAQLEHPPEGLSQQQQQEQQREASRASDRLRSLLYLAGGTINTLAVSTTEVVDSFLLPEMVARLAAMLNYFLLYLTGPERKGLKMKDPSKYNWNPKELLAQICRVYLNMYKKDKQGVFAAAVAADERSYRPQMFAEAANVLRQFQLMGEGEIQMLESLAGQVAQAAVEGQQEEEITGDIPEEFLDPIQYTLMKDPVILPTSDTIMDRATILRHLLSDERDPINRKPLTADMLVPAEELKARIRTWRKEQLANRMQS